MRDHILSEIRRLAAANDGQPPGTTLFGRATGISEHQWRGKFWARWGDALVEAGFAPNKWNERLDSGDILTGVIAACRHYGRLPTRDEIELYRRTDPSISSTQTLKRHFKTQADLVAALTSRAAEDANCADIAAMLPNVPPPRETRAGTKAAEGFVYLIQSGEFYKIGRSDEIERRVKEIRVALPDKAELVHSIRTDDPGGIEAYWHRRFADKRANGEWFKLSSLDVSAFKKRKFQ